MKEVQITELTKKVNEFRKEHIGRQYSSKELYEELYKLGFNLHISKRVAALFPAQKLGTSKYYEMTDEPIHQSKIAALYEASKKAYTKSRNKGEELTEKSALELLNTLGYRTGGLDGIFGSQTRNAVIQYQRSRGLAADGIVGCNTWRSLQENVVGTGRTSTTLD